MKTTTRYERGSEWRTWDLHVHSPLSILSNGFPTLVPSGLPDWDRYLLRLEQQNPAVLGVTDYFTVDGYKTLLTFQAQGRIPEIRLLPNIEFRLDKFVSTRSDGTVPRRLNLHVIFSETVTLSDIEDHFLHDLNFNYENTAGEKSSRLPLKPSNLEVLGHRLLAEEKSFAGRPAIQVGAMNAVVNPDELMDRLTSDLRFKGKYLIALPAENWDNIPWGGQDHQTRKLLLKSAHLVFASNPKTLAWCLGEPPYEGGPDQFMQEFGSLKPCIWGSDAHSLEFVGHPCSKRGVQGHVCSDDSPECDLRYCWLKADPTFEGLRQILYEPKARVRIQAADPTPQKSIFTIRSIDLTGAHINPEISITASHLPLNADLVAITGGKGTGKTALVDLLAHCFVDRATTTEKNSFVRRIAADSPDLGITLSFADGRTFAKHLSDKKYSEDASISYIAQGELEKYIDEQSDLDQYIHDVVFASPVISESLVAHQHETHAASVGTLQADIDATSESIAVLERETAPAETDGVRRQGARVKAELDDVVNRLQALEKNLTASSIAENRAREARVTQLKVRKQSLTTVRQLVAAIARDLDSEFYRLGETTKRLNNLIFSLGLGSQVAVPQYPDRPRLREIEEQATDALPVVVRSIEDEERQIQKASADAREHTRLLGKRKDLELELERLRTEWLRLASLKTRLAEERQTRADRFARLLSAVLAQRASYSEVITVFATNREDILNDLEFSAMVVLDADSLVQELESLVDNRQVQVLPEARAPSVCDALLERLRELAGGDADAVRTVCDETERLRDLLRGKLKRAVSRRVLDQALYRNRLSVRPVAYYKGTRLDRLSLGQKATVLIKIYLAAGDKPIIIDSHDDHLDNEYIMQELVGAIRQAKNARQVIIASNNGNVVMNSDAEQLIIAQRTDGRISYSSGSLEEPDVREAALRVLEGGYGAFKRRQEKYRVEQ